VTLYTPLPIDVGDIAGGTSVQLLLRYNVPVGVDLFRASMNGSAMDACGNSYTYP